MISFNFSPKDIAVCATCGVLAAVIMMENTPLCFDCLEKEQPHIHQETTSSPFMGSGSTHTSAVTDTSSGSITTTRPPWLQ